MGRVNIDAGQRNADWLRTRSWDLPTDKDAFLATIGGPAALDHFLTLPAAEAMPDSLRSALILPGAHARAHPIQLPPDMARKTFRVVEEGDSD